MKTLRFGEVSQSARKPTLRGGSSSELYRTYLRPGLEEIEPLGALSIPIILLNICPEYPGLKRI